MDSGRRGQCFPEVREGGDGPVGERERTLGVEGEGLLVGRGWWVDLFQGGIAGGPWGPWGLRGE